jgi:DNA-binding MarR family transcriptional regulator
MGKENNAELALGLSRQLNEMRYYLRCGIQQKLKEQKIDVSFELLEIMALLWAKDGINQQELADIAMKDKSSMTYLINNLTQRKLVKRSEHKNDRRNKMIFVTAKGKLFKQKVYPLVIELHKKATIGLAAVEIKNALSLLKNINKNLKEQ